MVNQRLVDYIKSNLKKGFSRQQIRLRLLSEGWSEYDINEALDSAQGAASSKGISGKLLIIILISIIAIIAVSILFMSGEEEPIPPPDSRVSYKDCGNSDSCFSNYAITCTPARATISEQGMTYVETIEGYEGNYCILTLLYTMSSAPELVGKEMECRVPRSETENFKNYFQGDRMKQSCEGSLIDFLAAEEATPEEDMEETTGTENNGLVPGNFELYQNEDYKFEIEYPSEWQKYGMDNFIMFSPNLSSETRTDVNIDAFDNKACGESLDEYLESWIEFKYIFKEPDEYSISDSTLSGKPAKEIRESENEYYREIITVDGCMAYHLQYETDKDGYEQYGDIIGYMISSFRILS